MIAAWAAGLLLASMAAGTMPAGPACQDDAVLGPLSRPGPARFTGSDAYRALRRSGREVVAEKTLDLDADGRLDALVVARSDAGLELSAYRNTAKEGFVLLSRSAVLAGDDLARFEPLDLAGRQGILLEVIEDSPDEVDRELALFVVNPAGLVQVLSTAWRHKHSEADAGRQAEEVINLGDRVPGLSIVPSGEGHWPGVELHYAPKELVFPSESRKPVRVVIGIRTRRFEHTGGRYAEVTDRFAPFLDAVLPVDGPAQLGAHKLETPSSVEMTWGGTRAIRSFAIGNCPNLGADAGELRKLKVAFLDGPTIAIDVEKPAAGGERILGAGTYRVREHVQTLVILREAVRAAGLTLTVERVEPAGVGYCISTMTAFTAKADAAATSSASSTPP